MELIDEMERLYHTIKHRIQLLRYPNNNTHIRFEHLDRSETLLDHIDKQSIAHIAQDECFNRIFMQTAADLEDIKSVLRQKAILSDDELREIVQCDREVRSLYMTWESMRYGTPEDEKEERRDSLEPVGYTEGDGKEGFLEEKVSHAKEQTYLQSHLIPENEGVERRFDSERKSSLDRSFTPSFEEEAGLSEETKALLESYLHTASSSNHNVFEEPKSEPQEFEVSFSPDPIPVEFDSVPPKQASIGQEEWECVPTYVQRFTSLEELTEGLQKIMNSATEDRITKTVVESVLGSNCRVIVLGLSELNRLQPCLVNGEAGYEIVAALY